MQFKRLNVLLDSSALNQKGFLEVFQNELFFKLVDKGLEADVIVFFKDDYMYIRKSRFFKDWPSKCIAINESDNPSYFLPSCYASNKKSFLSKDRSQTISYFLTARNLSNPFLESSSKENHIKYLYSFMGGSTSWPRKKLLKKPPVGNDVLVVETDQYNHWDFDSSFEERKMSMQEHYVDILKSSSFVLCPRGAGVSSIRLFEVMQLGKIPVIIADDWVPIKNIDWSSFSISVRENDISDLDNIIRSHRTMISKNAGALARQVWETKFKVGPDVELIAKSIKYIQDNRKGSREKVIRSFFPIINGFRISTNKAKMILKNSILFISKKLKMKLPFSVRGNSN